MNARSQLCLLAIAVTALPIACSDRATGPGPGGGNGPGLTLESGARISASVGALGKTIATTSSGGARYSLAVPASALRDTVTIAVTPISAVTVAPLSQAKVLAAVRMEPNGIRFAQTSVLTIDLPAGTNTSKLAGFLADGDGSAPHLVPIRVQGLKVTLLVPHFSIAGIVLDASLIPVPQNQATAAAEQGVATYLNSLNGQAPDIPTLATRFRAWYNAIVRPDLLKGQGGGADSTLLAAISENDEWLQTLAITDILNSLNGQLLDALHLEIVEDLLFIRAIANVGIKQSNATCRAQPATLDGQSDALIAASNALFWQSIARRNTGDAPPLDQTTVLAELCVQLDLQSVIFPAQLTVGQTVPLQVRAGVKIAARSVLAANLVNVTIQPAGAVVASGQPSNGGTQVSGFFDTQVTVQQAAVVINIHSCVDPGVAIFLSLICKDTLITRSNQPVVNGRYTGLIANALIDASVTLSGNALSGNWTETSGSDRFNRVGIAGSFAGTVSGTSLANFSLSQTSTATCQVTLPGSASIQRVGEINGVVDGPCFTTNATWFIRLKALGTATFVHGLYRCATVGCESFDLRVVAVLQFGDSLYVTTGDNVDAGLFRGKLVGTSFTGIGAGKNAQCTLGSGCVDDATRTITGTVDGSSFSGTQTTPAGTLTISGKKVP